MDQASCIFLIVIMIATYAYILFALRNTYDAGEQYGFPLTGFLAMMVALGTGVVAFGMLNMFGIAGYFIVGISFPPIINRLAKWMVLVA